MQLHRSSGVLMHVSSLYGSDSIGGFGQEAREFIDFLADCGFGWWQVLPFCMSDEYNSPYKSFSAFGGNPYFVDIRRLREEGLQSRHSSAISWHAAAPTATSRGTGGRMPPPAMSRSMRRGALSSTAS